VRSGGTDNAIPITSTPTIQLSEARPCSQSTAIDTQSRSLMEVSSRVGNGAGAFGVVVVGGGAVTAIGTSRSAFAVITLGPVTSNSAFQSPGITNVYRKL
jgi:hypothetical protein